MTSCHTLPACPQASKARDLFSVEYIDAVQVVCEIHLGSKNKIPKYSHKCGKNFTYLGTGLSLP